MWSNVLLVAGAFVFSLALRSFAHPLLHRIGTVGILVASFLAGWLLAGSVVLGCVLASTWILLPWLEILTHVRRLRLPINRSLAPRTPPARNDFPGLGELTGEIEEEGFEFVSDTGWDYDIHRHFYRIFYHPEKHMQAVVCLVEQSDLAFFYVSVSSRCEGGRGGASEFISWNYPFSYGLKPTPDIVFNRVDGAEAFRPLLESHEMFLSDWGVTGARVAGQDPDRLVEIIENDMRRQILHNLDAGLLVRDGEKLIRYSVRGMFFLWFQFLRDLVRIS